MKILYHGSYMEIPVPDLNHSRSYLDFGKGFYLTPYYDQAYKWCGKFMRRGKEGVISQYELKESYKQYLNVLIFDSYNEEWLDYILMCRSGNDSGDYDLVIGGVADDRVFNTIELYYDGLIDKSSAIHQLRYTKPNMQFCFRTEKALSFLTFKGSETIYEC